MTNDTTKSLIKDRRFWPLFWTQFLGAFNDNVLKNALVILIAFKDHTLWIFSSKQMVALCGGIFILPFFLFSATAGQLADKYAKPKIVFWIKVSEIGIACVGACGFIADNVDFLLAALFLMGLHSTFFGPVKYSILPQLLRQEELVSGTAYVEMGTFIAILLGTLLGGILIAIQGTGPWLVGAAVLVLASLGCLSSTKINRLEPVAPSLKIPVNPVGPTIEIVRMTAKKRDVFLSVLGISWFWCLGAAFLSLLPPYCKEFLHAEELVVTLFLALFSVGVGVGSLLCSRLSFQKLELGLVPLGALGLSLFALDLFLAGKPEALAMHTGATVTVPLLLSTAGGWRLVVDFLLFSVAGGFFIVPLYTAMQQRSDENERSRVVAGNNILNALAMVLSAFLLVGLFHLNFSIPQIFLMLSVLNAVVAVCIFSAEREFPSRCVCWVFTHLVRRAGVVDAGNLPPTGPALLVCDGCDPLDWMLVAGSCGRPVHFLAPDGRLCVPFGERVFRDMLLQPARGGGRGAGPDTAALMEQTVGAGGVVCLVRENPGVSREEKASWLDWVEEVVRNDRVPVVPVSIRCPGEKASRGEGTVSAPRSFNGFLSRRVMIVGQGIDPGEFSRERLMQALTELNSRVR